MANPTPPPKGNVVITDAEGGIKVVKNWLHQVAVLHPLTAIAVAFVIGQALALLYHV